MNEEQGGFPESEEFSDLPQDVQRLFQASYLGPFPNPLHEKITSDHITTLIEASIEDDKRRYNYVSSSRLFKVFYFLAGLVSLALLTVFLLPYNQEVYLTIVEWIIVFAGGFGAGRMIKKNATP